MSFAQEESNRIARLTGGNYSLATWSPGDGKTRYRIVKGDNDYFGGQAIVTALGKSEADTMISAFVQGFLAGQTT